MARPREQAAYGTSIQAGEELILKRKTLGMFVLPLEPSISGRTISVTSYLLTHVHAYAHAHSLTHTLLFIPLSMRKLRAKEAHPVPRGRVAFLHLTLTPSDCLCPFRGDSTSLTLNSFCPRLCPPTLNLRPMTVCLSGPCFRPLHLHPQPCRWHLKLHKEAAKEGDESPMTWKGKLQKLLESDVREPLAGLADLAKDVMVPSVPSQDFPLPRPPPRPAGKYHLA